MAALEGDAVADDDAAEAAAKAAVDADGNTAAESKADAAANTTAGAEPAADEAAAAEGEIDFEAAAGGASAEAWASVPVVMRSKPPESTACWGPRSAPPLYCASHATAISTLAATVIQSVRFVHKIAAAGMAPEPLVAQANPGRSRRVLDSECIVSLPHVLQNKSPLIWSSARFPVYV